MPPKTPPSDSHSENSELAPTSAPVSAVVDFSCFVFAMT